MGGSKLPEVDIPLVDHFSLVHTRLIFVQRYHDLDFPIDLPRAPAAIAHVRSAAEGYVC